MQRKLQRWFRVLRFVGSDMAARAALRLYQRPTRRKLDESDVATLERAKVTNIESGNEMLRVLQWCCSCMAGARMRRATPTS